VESDTQASERGAPPELQPLDAGGTATLHLNRAWRSGGEIWLLTHAGKPVGMLKRAAGRTTLRTASEEWRGGVRRRRRRLGWHLYFARARGGETGLQYYPSTLLPGGDFVVSGSRRYRLRHRLVGADWRLAARPGGEVGRIGARGPWRYLSVELTSVEYAVDEPVLLIVILAAIEAILIDKERPSGLDGAWG
jgi:hypothetical protein